MQIIGLKTCDTCRKARKALPDADFVDVRGDGVPEAVLAEAMARFGDALTNTRSTTWRGLDDVTRALPQAKVLAAHPTLMKRPLIVDGADMYLGWTAEIRCALGVDNAG